LFELSGQPVAQGIVRDITERKRAQEALARQSKELARINAELERHTVQLEWLTTIQAALSQARTVEDILTAIAMGIDVDQPPNSITLQFLETDERGQPTHARPVAVWEDGLIVSDHPDLQRVREIAGSTLAEIWLETPHDPVFIADAETDPRVEGRTLPFTDGSDFRSAILMPLHSGGRWQGVVTVLWPQARAFSEEESFYLRQLLEPLAAIVASRRAYLAQQESEARYRALFNSASDATFIYDMTGELLAVNDVACERLGYDRDDLLRMTIGDIDAPEEAPQVAERIENLRRRQRLVFETFQVRADGTKVPVEVSSRLIDYRGQKAVLSDSRDISERLEMEEQLQRQERLAAVGQLAGGIAHDFRNFLTTIILYAGMPLRKGGLDPQIENALEVITSEAQQASDLVQQILDFSGRSAVQTQPVDLVEFIEEGADILQQTIPENIDVTLEIDPTAAVVNADPTRIQQVLMNLALNARDAMPEGGSLKIGLSTMTISPGGDPPVAGMEPGEWVCLIVSDTGTGMSQEVKSRIFEPFFTTKAPGKGTGLGLAQVYGIVQQHHGAIDVETEAGAGSSFYVYLPTHGEGKTEEEERDTSVPQGNGEMILLVEDQENLREAGREMLTALDYRVLTAANGEEALETLQGIMVDLVITDIVMPQMGGKALMQKLRQMFPDLPTLAVTGYTMDQEMETLMEMGFADVLHKPFDAPGLAQSVRRALET
jgi:PAS domain S-box-containing protein